MRTVLLLLLAVICINCALPRDEPELHCTGECQRGANYSRMSIVMHMKETERAKCVAAGECPRNVPGLSNVKCTDGLADVYGCKNIDLLAFVPHAQLGASGANGNDIWGWTDQGKEYALVGQTTGTSFVDITNPVAPCVLGYLATHTQASVWRDIKVYRDHAYIVSEAPDHGMQVFDLTQLRGMTCGDIRQLKATAHYAEFGSAHNLVINEESGFAYSVGSKTCGAGLHVVDIRVPLQPKFVGCFGEDGYVHDAQCVNYRGPDQKYAGKEICFCYNEDSLTIVDVSNKQAMKMIARAPYQGVQYTHQGWLLPNQAYLLLDDELDEIFGTNKHTRTMLWDVRDLEKPTIANSFYSTETVVDHNLYTLGTKAYLSNYCAGLRVYDTTAAMNGGEMTELAYFDVSPDCDTTQFLGSWSSYIYFPSGNLVVDSIERGLFIVKLTQ